MMATAKFSFASIMFFAANSPVGFASKASVDKFLIISTPRDSKVVYVRIKPGGLDYSDVKPQNLVSGALKSPQGLAVDSVRSRLYVADPDEKVVMSYRLTSGGDYLAASDAKLAINDTESRWIAVDGMGNLYATNEGTNQILKTTPQKIEKGNLTAEVIYDGSSVASVSAPGGIAVDSFNTYWANKKGGATLGSVVKGRAETKPPQSMLQTDWSIIADNSEKTYGVCMATSNIFYTQPDAIVYGVRKTGGGPQVVTDRLTNPRGCAWDGDGTVYVADRGANAVFSFAGNMQKVGAAMIQRAVSVDDAFGVAVFSGTRSSRVVGLFVTALVAIQAFIG